MTGESQTSTGPGLQQQLHKPAAAAAKSLQSCLTLWDPIDSSPTGPAIPGILQARTLEWVAISSSNAWKWKVKVKLLSHVLLLATPWTAAYQAPPPMGFSRQEYWSGVPLPPEPPSSLLLYSQPCGLFGTKHQAWYLVSCGGHIQAGTEDRSTCLRSGCLGAWVAAEVACGLPLAHSLCGSSSLSGWLPRLEEEKHKASFWLESTWCLLIHLCQGTLYAEIYLALNNKTHCDLHVRPPRWR